jgi:phytoene dehydrogenase-like protein
LVKTFKPPATQRIYDVCVVGSQLGGALAGALLARRGHRVLHIDHDGLGASYVDGGYLLPYAPALIPSPRILPAAEAALGELGLTTDIVRQLEPSSPDLQLLLPRHRVDIGHVAPRRLQELKREWPHEADRLQAGFEELARLFEASTPFMKSMPPLPPAGFGERRAVSKAIKFAASVPGGPHAAVDEARAFEGLEGHPLVAALGIAQRFLSYQDGTPSPLATTRLLGALLLGSHRLAGGHVALCDAIRRKIAEPRGETLGNDDERAVAERLETDRGRVTAVRIAGSPNAWVARVFIAATDAPALRRLLPVAEADGKTARLLEEVKPSRQLLTVNLVVKIAALPPALGDTVLALRDPADPDAAENAVLVQVLPARRDKGKGAAEVVADERVLSAAAFVPADARDLGDEHLAALGRQIRDAVADAVPFFERHLVRESMPVLAAPKERRGSRLLPHPLYAVGDLDPVLGVTGLPCRAPLKNLVFAGREVVPGLGLEGEFHAGVQAAQAAQELLGHKELLR